MRKMVFRTHPILSIGGRFFSFLLISIPLLMLYSSIKFMILEFDFVWLFYTAYSIAMVVLCFWIQKYFWHFFWGKIIITNNHIIWKCLFTKKQVMPISKVKFVCRKYFVSGNVVPNNKSYYKNGSCYILISTLNSLPNLRIDKIKTTDGIIKFPMTDKLSDALKEVFPQKYR